MAILRLSGALLLAALLLGCTRDPLPIQPMGNQVMVHSVLEAGADTAFVHLTEIRVRALGGTFATQLLSGALVELTGAGGTLLLREAPEGFARCLSQPTAHNPWGENPVPDGRGCYAALVPGGIRPGEQYALRILLSDGRVVHGAAQIPASLELVRPLSEPRLHAVPGMRGMLETEELVTLRWRASPATPGITVFAWSETVFGEGRILPGEACHALLEQQFHVPGIAQMLDPARADSIAQRVIVTGCGWQGQTFQQRPDSLHVRVRVTALDSAYVRYLEWMGNRGESVRVRDIAIGLEGAVGVFAGLAPVDQRLVVIPRSQPAPRSE